MRRIGRKLRTKVWLHAQKLDTRLKVRGKVAEQTEAQKLSGLTRVNQGSIRQKDYVLNRGGLWGEPQGEQ
ncbi:MAG: hypothetical protein HDR88_14720 [Bacteroides sp.]|nr:hypothetical protein [Bacteroides sp.]